MAIRLNSKGSLYGAALVALFGLSACVERAVTAPSAQRDADPDARSGQALATLDCSATVSTRSLECAAPTPSSNAEDAGASKVLIGGQNSYVKLTSSNVSYNSGTEIFQFDVTVQNLMNEAIGTPDGTVADPEGIQVFFYGGPSATSGTGTITVANADGVGDFTGTNQPFFAYHNILVKNAVSPAKTWQLNMPNTVGTFGFQLLVETDTQPLLVINELLSNPGGTISDANGEWIELYNAGTRPLNLQDVVLADSSAAGRRPYNIVGSSVPIPAGAYIVIGNTTNTTNNGGVPVDYAYGAGMAFANSLDAFKISRVYGTDTLTIDRTQYASAAISAQNGVSRELKNPALDNSNMDGSNWGDAQVTAVYGPGGRGTPKAQNSSFVP